MGNSIYRWKAEMIRNKVFHMDFFVRWTVFALTRHLCIEFHVLSPILVQMWPNFSVDISPQKMLDRIMKLPYFGQLFAKVTFHEQLWAVLIFRHLCSQRITEVYRQILESQQKGAATPIVGKLR